MKPCRLISAREIHQRDMKDPAYRRAHRRQWLGHHIVLAWLRLKVELRRRWHAGTTGRPESEIPYDLMMLLNNHHAERPDEPLTLTPQQVADLAGCRHESGE